MSPGLLGLCRSVSSMVIFNASERGRAHGRTMRQIFPDNGQVHFYLASRDLWQTGPVLDTAFKIKSTNDCIEAGLMFVEPGSFVSKKRVPQMADSDLVIPKIIRPPDSFVVGLIGNQEGFDRAVKAGVDGIALMGGTTDAFFEKNIGCTLEESFKERYAPIIKQARERNIRVLYYQSGSFTCPVTRAPISFDKVNTLAKRAMDMGSDQLIVCDTTGDADPKWTSELFASLSKVVPILDVAFHAHGIAPDVFENVKAYVKAGGRVVHGSLGDKGMGCSSLQEQKIKGNVALDELIPHFQKLSISIDPKISADKVVKAKLEYEQELTKPKD